MSSSSDFETGKTITAAGIATHYLESGSGFPVLLIHGSGPGTTAYSNWRLTIPELNGKFRVLAPELVGYGDSERPPAIDYSLDLWVRHALGFLDALKIPKAHLVGNSFGGAVALGLLARHPERFEKVVLTGSLGTEFALTPALDAVWGYTPSRPQMEQLIRLYVYDKSIVTPELIDMRYQASLKPGYQEAYARLFPTPRQRHVAALATPEAALRAITHRMLIFHGRDDQVIPWEASIALHRLVPRSALHVFGQCGHWTTVEKRVPFHHLMTSFLAG